MCKAHAIRLALAVALAFCGCSRQKPVVTGGGEHRIIQILIRAYSKQASLQDRGPLTLVVGEQLQLRAMAAWAIPSITEVTDQAEWTVSDAAIGDMDKNALFTARKAGRAVVTAVVRVSENGAGEVLGAGQAPDSGSVKTFRDELELNVVAASAAPAPGAPK